MKFICLLILFFCITELEAVTRCVWTTGIVQCERNPKAHANIKIYLLDRDGYGIFQWFDNDDLMSVAETDENGAFKINGCGSDPDFLGIIENLPEPYILIKHYCNLRSGEYVMLPEFYNFVPNSHDAGYIDLESGTYTQNTNWILKKIGQINKK